MTPRKKNATPTISLVNLLPYFTCMKNSTTSVALKTAIVIATGKFRSPRLINAAITVRIVHTINAPKMVMYVDLGEICPDIALDDMVRSVHEIEQREQENPDDVDEVPVEAAEFHRCVPLRREALAICHEGQGAHQPNADDHVKRVHAGQREIQREKDLHMR